MDLCRRSPSFVLRWLAPLAGAALLIACEPPSVNVGDGGITIVEDIEGHGRQASPGRIVRIHYRLEREDGTEILSDRDYRFELGVGSVIEGIDEAVEGMRTGGTRTVRIPPHKHWGRTGYSDGAVPPNTTLIGRVELVAIE